MMSKKSSLLIMTTLVCIIFVTLTQTNPLYPLNKRQVAGAVAYADFTDQVTGRFTWTNIPENKCRVTGQWNTGFESPDVNEYSFFLENGDGISKRKVPLDLTKVFRSGIRIYNNGTTPFQHDFPSSRMSVESVVGLKFAVIHKKIVIARALIQRV